MNQLIFLKWKSSADNSHAPCRGLFFPVSNSLDVLSHPPSSGLFHMAKATSTVPAPAAAQQEYKSYRDFNNSCFEARISHVEIVEFDGAQWAAVTAITTLEDGTDGIQLQFNSSNGILALARAGHMSVGRRVHVTGAIKSVESHYVDSKTGQVVPLKRARIRLIETSVRLGPKPKA